jgi:uncharacterized membrane protein YeaQ/YmgE (transglycosylase-associated protein family)
MNIFWIILIGFLAGVIAKLLTPGKNPKGCIITVLLGIGGSMLFTYLGQYFGFYSSGEKAGFIGAVIGAIIILVIYRALRKT